MSPMLPPGTDNFTSARAKLVPMEERIATEVDGVGLTLTHLDRPLFPDGFTKGELVSYYLEVSDALLPHLADRAVTRVRFPEGTAKEGFYEKNLPGGAPSWVRTIPVATTTGTVDYVAVDGRPALVWLANLAAVELHTTQWRASDATQGPDGVLLEGNDEPRATTLVVDLDPGPGVGPEASAKAALLAATALAELGLECHPKSSGNKGLQLGVALRPTPCSRVFAFAQALAKVLARAHPTVFTATMAKDARPGLVYVDYSQNLAARNTVAPYSVRGLSTPRVSTPLTWGEVAALRPGSTLGFSPAEVLERVQRHGDLWQAVLTTAGAPDLPEPPA
ncbi:MAG: non-homologous end-joining DNA ligase [Arachnia sp.]